MRHWILILLLMCMPIEAKEGTYIVQSKVFHGVYGNTVVDLLRSAIDGRMKVLNERDFSTDVHQNSKTLTEANIASKASEFSNLILLGFDRWHFSIAAKDPIYIPVLADTDKTKHRITNTKKILELLDLDPATSSLYRSTIYMVNDTTKLSLARFGALKHELTPYKYINLVPVTVKSVYELKQFLTGLNKPAQQRVLLINNIFGIVSPDSSKSLSLSSVDRLFVVWNEKHYEIGTFKDDSLMGISIGYSAEEIVRCVTMKLNTKTFECELVPSIQINITRLQSLGIEGIFLNNLNRIDFVEANK
jgi:hypothetical protein